jgi:hypothetical protein
MLLFIACVVALGAFLARPRVFERALVRRERGLVSSVALVGIVRRSKCS